MGDRLSQKTKKGHVRMPFLFIRDKLSQLSRFYHA